MLKLTYTETSFYLECFAQSLEEWIAQRVILSLRIGQSLCIQPSTASFLLPVDLPGLKLLEAEVQRGDSREIVSLCSCDSEYVEVTLRGSWLSVGSENDVGVFVTTMGDRSEFFLYQLWLEAQAVTSVISE